MAGLAAMIGVRDLTAVAAALTVRGPETAGWRVGGIQLVVSAAMPAVHEGTGHALVIDGNAAPSAVATGYAERGPAGLLPPGLDPGRGTEPHPDPYAVILADPDREALLLARHGDGPPLYWARRGAAILAASEPVALLAAGVPAEPDPHTVARFLATGACDDTAATFFAGIQRVLPGQVVEIRRDPGASGFTVQVHALAAPRRPAPVTGRVGVRLCRGEAGLAVLEQVLRAPGSPRPLPVYSAAFPELAATGWSGSHGQGQGQGQGHSHGHGAAPALGELGRSAAVRHRALPFFADEIDVDAYLSDLGEPTPYLDDWLLWAVARRVAGEVDALVDTAADPLVGPAGDGYRSRLADRIGARFGVVVAPAAPLPPTGGSAQPPALVADLLRRMRAELVTTFLEPRYGDRTGSGLAELVGLLAGERVDPAALWRRYLLERWLRCVVEPAAGDVARRMPTPIPTPTPTPIQTPTRIQTPTPAATLVAVAAAGRRWFRHPVRTEALAAGDKLPEKLAWYVGEGYATCADAGLDRSAEEPWYVLLAAKPVAVMQGRARSLWDIEPGLAARLLHRFATRRDPGRQRPATPFVTQVAIEECGWWRAVVAATAAALGRTGWYGRLAGPAGAAIRGPRGDAVPPGHVSVIPAPAEPDRVAADVVAALRTALPDAAYATLAGCAVVSAAGDLLGWAARAAGATAPPRALCCPGDPFGDDNTPIVLAMSATDGGQ